MGDNVAYGDHTKPTSVEVWLANRVPGYRYGIVLALLAITYIVMASDPPDPWTRVLTVFLQGATLLAAFVVSVCELAALSYCRGRRRPIASHRDLVGGCQLVDSADQRLLPPEHPPGRERACRDRTLALAAPDGRRSHGARRYLHLRVARDDVRVLYAAINGFGDSPFFVQTTRPTTANFLYFSFVTQTTVGYGDFTAAGGLGRTLAVLEALTGQLYLVTVIAVLVSRLGSPRMAGGSPPAPPTDHEHATS